MSDEAPQSDPPFGDGQRVSRRRILASSAVLLGGGAALVGTSGALFSDSGTSTGSLDVDDDPTLNYTITDETQNNNAEYAVTYQVAWVADFDRIEIRVENLDAGHIGPETYTRTVEEGTIQYPPGGGSDGGAEGDTYEFQFDVYESGTGSPVIQRTITDVADGGGQSEGDMGSADDPVLDSFTVTDQTQYNNTDYVVDYQLSNVSASNFSQVVVTFDDNANNWADATETSTAQPNGSVTYAQGGTEGDTYTITVEVENENGLVVDSGSVDDVADGSNSQYP